MLKKNILILCMLLIALFFLHNCDSEGTNAPSLDSENTSTEVTDPYGLISVPSVISYPMCWVGSDVNFWNGDEEPVHNVGLDEFCIGKHEVTYNLWNEVKTWAESNGYVFSNEGIRGGSSSNPYPTDITDEHPVTSISWRDCIAWCNAYSEKEGLSLVYYTSAEKNEFYKDSRAIVNQGDGEINNDCVDWSSNGFRLPSEAEWEYAARYLDGSNVTSGEKHSGFNIESVIDLCVWYEDNAPISTKPVGQLQSNSLGLFDMSGNVSEWCWDDFEGYSETYAENPRGPNTNLGQDYYYRVHRGGDWSNAAISCSAAYRAFGKGTTSIDVYTGFRVVRIE